MSDSAAIDELAKTVLEKHGGVDILVNNVRIRLLILADVPP